MYRLICHECSGLQRRKKYDDRYKCIRCSSSQMPLTVTQELIKSTQGLIKLGFHTRDMLLLTGGLPREYIEFT